MKTLTEHTETIDRVDLERKYGMFDGYFTIKTDKVDVCGCGRRLEFVEVDTDHRIVVWEEKDDDAILQQAAHMMKLKLGPRIVEYKVGYGPAVEFYDAIKKGLIAGK